MNKTIGCFIIHGFGGSIKEILPLAQYLDKEGFITCCPQLKGHTGKRRDLSHVRYTDWIESAENELKQFKSQCEYIVLIGFSMGGLIAVNLAAKYGIDAMVTLNMPIFHWDFNIITQNIWEDLKNKKCKYIKHYLKASFNKPLYSLINFKILLHSTKPLLKKIRCPIFIVQAMEDDTVQHRSADYIYNNVSSSNKEVKYYRGSGHLICYSNAADKVFDDAAHFIKKTVFNVN